VDETGQPYAYTGDDPVNGTDPLGLCNLPSGAYLVPGACQWTSQSWVLQTEATVEAQGHSSGFSITRGLEGVADFGEGAANTVVSGVTLGHQHVGESFSCVGTWQYDVGQAYGLVAVGALGGEEVDAADVGESEEDLNLATEARTQHILEGDGPGSGGHLWPGAAGKTPFPASWSSTQIMNTISDVATDPEAWQNALTQGSRTVLSGSVDGVDVQVVVNSETGKIITGFPTNLPRNP
jgi:Bacterial EndoU nuclease